MKLKISLSSRNKLQYRGNSCLNCERKLKITHQFCPYCGQLNSTKKLSLTNYFGEFITSIINYDSRIRYTLQDLLFKPGKITLRYVNGKRLTYANPFRFYLSISIIYFLLSGFLDFIIPERSSTSEEGFNLEEVTSQFNNGDYKISLDSIQYYRENYNELKAKADSTETPVFLYTPENEINRKGFYGRTKEKLVLFQDFANTSDIKNSRQALDSLRFKKSRINIWLYDRSTTYNRILEEPLAFISYLTKKIPIFLFFFTPVFALFFVLVYFKRESLKSAKLSIKGTSSKLLKNLTSIPYLGPVTLTVLGFLRKLFFIYRERTYIEHVIFIFHVFTFVFLGLLLALLPDSFLGHEIFSSLFLVFVGPVYFYIALKKFYKEGHLRTLTKFLFLNIVFLILSTFAGILFLLVTAATY
ncbi:DUF3667 domain-containing protein [Leeuwenhoekiella sp. NPDC079379]|uniref:DUF3667 domain-containing protein n=1 Tax=Leeuwenhoekiella sp. NPDC079379 TaxID=3364122 RepID=UPI0037CA78DC